VKEFYFIIITNSK